MTKLFITDINSGSERCIELPEKQEIVLGRQDICDIILPENTVSRRHAILKLLGECWFIEDSNSSSGTKVNDTKISSLTPFEENDVVRIGNSLLSWHSRKKAPGSAEVRASAPAPAPAPAPARSGSADSKKAREALDELTRKNRALYIPESMQLILSIHREVTEALKLTEEVKIDHVTPEFRRQVEKKVDEILLEKGHEIPQGIRHDDFRQALLDEILDLGPISPLLKSPDINEIMINGPDIVFVELKSVGLCETGVRFFNPTHLNKIIQRIVEPLGRRVDTASPMVDARLADGSRVNAIIPPLALDGASVTIRKFSEKKLTCEDLINFGSMTRDMALFLEEAVRARQNIIVSGGTGSGKTTLLNVLSLFIPENERVVTIEDSAEL